MNNQQNVIVIYAANGNPTGIMCMPDASRRSEYADIAKECMKNDPRIEQFGFLEVNDNFLKTAEEFGVNAAIAAALVAEEIGQPSNGPYFQMSGGEFCGNAARAVALLIAELSGRVNGSFTMSGFVGPVSYQVFPGNVVQCSFDNFRVEVKEVVTTGMKATLVDMGGIVHVVLPTDVPFVNKREVYEPAHKRIVRELNLEDRLAVGVIWRRETESGTAIYPVVWVKEIGSFFYETACGSGTLATLLVGEVNSQEILQPSGCSIYAEKIGERLILRSQMSYA